MGKNFEELVTGNLEYLTIVIQDRSPVNFFSASSTQRNNVCSSGKKFLVLVSAAYFEAHNLVAGEFQVHLTKAIYIRERNKSHKGLVKKKKKNE